MPRIRRATSSNRCFFTVPTKALMCFMDFSKKKLNYARHSIGILVILRRWKNCRIEDAKWWFQKNRIDEVRLSQPKQGFQQANWSVPTIPCSWGDYKDISVDKVLKLGRWPDMDVTSFPLRKPSGNSRVCELENGPLIDDVRQPIRKFGDFPVRYGSYMQLC